MTVEEKSAYRRATRPPRETQKQADWAKAFARLSGDGSFLAGLLNEYHCECEADHCSMLGHICLFCRLSHALGLPLDEESNLTRVEATP